MARTKADLSRSVLTQLRILAAGEPLSARDAAFVEGRYDSKLAQWRRLGFVWWPNTNRTTEEIPDEVFSILGDLMQNELESSYREALPVVQKRAFEVELLRELRKLNHKPPSGEVTPFSSY